MVLMTTAIERLQGTVKIGRQLASQVWCAEAPSKLRTLESAHDTPGGGGNRPRHDGELDELPCLSPGQSAGSTLAETRHGNSAMPVCEPGGRLPL